MELTILILCRNEEGSIAHCISEARGFLERNAISGEVVVVDNNSQDNSAALSRDAGALVVSEPSEGYGNAIKTGIEASRGRFIILGDGDGEHDLGALEPFWRKLKEGHAFVFGDRFIAESRGAAQPLIRRMGVRALSGIGRLLFKTPIADFHCGLRAFRASSARSLALKSSGMEIASEMVLKLALKGDELAVVPVVQRRALAFGRNSQVRPLSDGWRHLRLLLAFSPRWSYLYPGCFLLIAGASAIVASLAFPEREGGVFGVFTTLMGAGGAVCGLHSIVLASLSIRFIAGAGLAGERRADRRRRDGAAASCTAGVALLLAGGAGILWSPLMRAAMDDPSDVYLRMRFAIILFTLFILGFQVISSGLLRTLLAYCGDRTADGDRKHG